MRTCTYSFEYYETTRSLSVLRNMELGSCPTVLRPKPTGRSESEWGSSVGSARVSRGGHGCETGLARYGASGDFMLLLLRTLSSPKNEYCKSSTFVAPPSGPAQMSEGSAKEPSGALVI